MPHYFFSIRRNGCLIPDTEGDELPDVEAARALALDIVHEMKRLPHIYGAMREWQKDEFVVTDEAGRTVLELPLARTGDKDDGSAGVGD